MSNKFVRSKEIVDRLGEVKVALGIKNWTAFAKCIKLGTSHMSQIRSLKKPLMPDQIEILELRHRINPKWLQSGEGPMILPSSHVNCDLPSDVAELLDKARYVLMDGKEHLRDSLKSNIVSFYESQKIFEQVEKIAASQQDQARRISKLEKTNAILRSQREELQKELAQYRKNNPKDQSLTTEQAESTGQLKTE